MTCVSDDRRRDPIYEVLSAALGESVWQVSIMASFVIILSQHIGMAEL